MHYVDVFSQGAAILDAKDPEGVRRLYRATMQEFGEGVVARSRVPREAAIARFRAGEIGEDELPTDILTVLLLHREDPALELDEGRLVREVSTYLQGGTHTASQTLVNFFDLWWAYAEAHPGAWQRLVTDPAFAQRCMHETLRLRPTTPKIKRHAEADTVVAGVAIPAGATVVLDAIKGNRDPGCSGRTRTRSTPTARWTRAWRAGGCRSAPARTSAPAGPWPAASRRPGPDERGRPRAHLRPRAADVPGDRRPRPPPRPRQPAHPRRPHRALHPLGDLPRDLLGVRAGVAPAPRRQCAAAQSMRMRADSSGACQK